MKIRFNLSQGSLQAAIEQTKVQATKMARLRDVFAKKLAMEAVDHARMTLLTEGAVFTETLLEGVKFESVAPGVWKVSAYAPTPDGKNNYAWYVEFGTGPKGKASKHPDADGMDYSKNGWWTAADGKDMEAIYGWAPHKGYKNGQSVYYTTGQEAVRFMYDSRQHITDPEVYNRIFKEAIQEVMHG